MLKLILADDEKVIRETISSLIDWNSLGLELAATCENGPETLQAILDIKPDIVMTDIKMPGMSGLDLIGRICTGTDLTVEFILLSGYADFEYAKQAIAYKVSNYLLKPCNENQIMEAMKKPPEKSGGGKNKGTGTRCRYMRKWSASPIQRVYQSNFGLCGRSFRRSRSLPEMDCRKCPLHERGLFKQRIPASNRSEIYGLPYQPADCQSEGSAKKRSK